MLTSVIIIGVAVITACAVNMRPTKAADEGDFVRIGEIYGDCANVQKLYNLIGGAEHTDLAKITELATAKTNAADIRAKTYNKTNGQDIQVTFGGQVWDVVYLSTTNDNRPILTLWLHEPFTESQWNKWSLNDASVKYPSNMYGTSYIRALINNGGQYAADGGISLTDYTPVTDYALQEFLPDGKYGDLIVTPSYVDWQKEGQEYRVSAEYDWENDPNANWGKVDYKFQTLNGVTLNYSGREGHDSWKNDNLWLGSLNETYKYVKTIFGLRINQRFVGLTHWARSGYLVNNHNDEEELVAYSYYATSANEQDNHYENVTSTNGVRPALHLDLQALNAARTAEHNYGDWSTTTPATFTTNGVIQRVCQGCGHTESQVIPAVSAVTVANDGVFTYTGSAIVPEITVMAGDTVLQPQVDYEVNITNNTNVGAAGFILTGKGNYQGTYTGNFNIVPQVITRPAADTTVYTYYGEPQTYQLTEHAAYIISTNTTQTNAGQYSITVSLKNTSNYVWDNQTTGNLTYQFEIKRAVVPIPTVQTVALDANDELLIDTYYRSDEYVVSRIRLVGDGTDTTNYLGQPVKNGSYKVEITLLDQDNYLWQDGTNGTQVVDFAINVTYEPNELSGELQIAGWEYGEIAANPTGVTAKYGTVGYYYTTEATVADLTQHELNIADWTSWFSAVPSPADTYYLLAYVPATDPKNTAVHSDVVSFTITPKTVTVSQVIMAVKTFDGTTDGAGQIAISGVVNGDVVHAGGVFAWDDSAAGTKTFTVRDLVLDNDNYVLADTEYHGTDSNGILWRVVMKPAQDIRTFTYNGREQIYDLPHSDYYTADGLAQIAAGEHTVTVALNDTVNYQWNDGTHAALSFPFTIAKADLTMTVSMADFLVDTEPTVPVITATLNGTEVTDLPWVVTFAAVGDVDSETIPTAIGAYRVTVTLTDHQNFNDITAKNYFQINQLVKAADGKGSLVIAKEGNYALSLTAKPVNVGEYSTSVAYNMQITRDDTAVDRVENVELQILVPQELQELARENGEVAFNLLQKNLLITVSGSQKIAKFNLVTQNDQVYAVFAYSGAGQAEVGFAYAVASTPASNSPLWWGIILGSVAVLVGCGGLAWLLVVIIKKKRPKKLHLAAV